jgi:alpha-L-rhamnosidase
MLIDCHRSTLMHGFEEDMVAPLCSVINAKTSMKEDGVMPAKFSRRSVLKSSVAFCASVPLLAKTAFADAPQSLDAGFLNPPASAKPRVWWHWMNGNVTREGIDADFAWMQRAGIGGVHNFDASLRTPQVVKKRIVARTPDWAEIFRYAVQSANKNGMEFTIAGSPGWSQTGGPWVKPEQAMKKLVWSDMTVDGGKPIAISLPKPPDTIGPYGSKHIEAKWTPETHPSIPQSYYRDVMVLAYKTQCEEEPLNKQATITSPAGPVDGSKLVDGDFDTHVALPYNREKDKSVWLDFAFPEARTVRSVTLYMSGGVGPWGSPPKALGWIEASEDGVTYKRVVDFPGLNQIPRTISLPDVKAKRFRFYFNINPNARIDDGFFGKYPLRTQHEIMLLELREAPRVHLYEDKAGFWDPPGLNLNATPDMAADMAINPDDIIDVTQYMKPDGRLEWTPPPGRWQILRLGFGLTGETNGPTLDELTGLEVDKLNRTHVRAYVDNYLRAYESALGKDLMGARGLTHMLTDSYEAGHANWTDNIVEKFKAFAGYDMRPWIPALAGRVVRSAADSDRFLWDFRDLLGNLMAEDHYGEISRALHDRGMKRYGEGHEDRRAFVGDGMQAKKHADIPMGATWMPDVDFPHSSPTMRDADIRESASVAHLYGQNINAAESFTADGQRSGSHGYAPRHLKPVADRMMANGLNRIVVHTSVHQPDDSIGPGLSLGRFGQWFTRKETWADKAHAWISYLSRSCHLLQQGRFAADVAYFYGQDDNVTELFAKRDPEIPQGYAFDFINADAILNLVKAADGRLRTPSGMSYRALVIDTSVTQMTLPVLKKLAEFAKAGIPIIGPKPRQSPSLADDPQAFGKLADDFWQYGASATPAAEALPRAFQPAFSYTAADKQSHLLFVQRHIGDAELFFVTGQNATPQKVEASFRVSGYAPEFWDAAAGTIKDAPYRMEGGRTIVPLDMSPNGAIFVMFRKRTSAKQRVIPAKSPQEIATLDQGWAVTFRHPGPGGKTTPAEMPKLISWTELADPALKYFSGTATYTRSFTLKEKPQGRIMFDLGEVGEIAELFVNDKSAGIAWTPPFMLDISKLVKRGENRLRIEVANLWVNRMIGDMQPGAAKVANVQGNPYKDSSPLRSSGLLGPVRVISI